jgi:hypothetical protein
VGNKIIMAKKQGRKNRKETKVKEEGKSEEKVKKSVREKENKQLIWFFVVVILVFASFLGTYFYFQSLKTFDFAGVEWVKEDYQNLELYHGRFPIVYKGEYIANYNLYFRNDPRENNVSVVKGIKMRFWPEVIISNSPEAAECSGASRVTSDLGMFIKAFPWIKNLTGAVNDKEVAEEYNLFFANCSTAMEDYNKTVIIIKKLDEEGKATGPKILKEENYNCYAIYIGECENSLAVERFILEVLKQMPSGSDVIDNKAIITYDKETGTYNVE